MSWKSSVGGEGRFPEVDLRCRPALALTGCYMIKPGNTVLQRGLHPGMKNHA
jgi:hypothetical protein